MLKKKLIPLLLLGLVLSGCGNTNNNSSSTSEPNSESVTESVSPSESEDPVESESESEEASESEQPSESESEEESESTGPSIPKEVSDKIGSKEAFIKFHNDNWSKLPNCEHLLLREEDFD